MTDDQLDRLLFVAQELRRHSEETVDLTPAGDNLIVLCDGVSELVAAYRRRGNQLLEQGAVVADSDPQEIEDLKRELAVAKSALEMARTPARPVEPPKPGYRDGIRYESPHAPPEIGPDGFPRPIV